jgi:hypothetical protein
MRRTVPATTAIALVTLLLVVGVACTHKGPAKMDAEAINAVTSRIQAELQRRPDVVKAQASYQDNVSASGEATVAVTVKAGTDFEPVIDEALRLIWQSTLNPLSSIRVSAIDADDLQRGTVRHVNADTQKGELDGKYGSHPR